MLILLVGMPPSWSHPSPSARFSPDHGNVYVDENAALLPHYPLEPVFRALQVLAPMETVSDMDLITCDTTIEMLLLFCQGCGKGYRFDVEIVGETAIFTRTEEENTGFVSDYSSYRTSILEKQTKWDTGENESQSHYRIAKCSLGGLKCLLRYEGQAYIPEEDQSSSPMRHNQPAQVEPDYPGKFYFIPRALGNSGQRPLLVRFGEKEIPQRQMAYINTEDKIEPNFERLDLSRLYLSNTTTAVTVASEQGFFKHTRIDNFRSMTSRWERVHRGPIIKLASLIRMIISAAKGVPGGKCWVNIAGSLGLYVMAPTSTLGLMSLPADIKEAMFGIPNMNKSVVGGT